MDEHNQNLTQQEMMDAILLLLTRINAALDRMEEVLDRTIEKLNVN